MVERRVEPSTATVGLMLPAFADVAALTQTERAERWTLRGPDAALDGLCAALGLARPQRLRATVAGSRAAFWLGPDEILALAELGAAPVDFGAGSDGAAVEVGDKFVGLDLAGRRADAVLASHCPQNLSLAAFPVGKVSRTLYAKVEIVLWRRGASSFRIEVVRSFAPYLVAALTAAAEDLAALDRR